MQISNTAWFLIGQALFGALIGFLVGLSISPVVSTVLGLLFAAIGGSIVVLIKDRSPSELAVIGKSIAALAASMVIGVTIGIYFRANDVLSNAAGSQSGHPLRAAQLAASLTLEDIKHVGAQKAYAGLLCQLLQTSPRELDRSQLLALAEAKVDVRVLRALVGVDVSCVASSGGERKGSGTVVYGDDATPADDDRDDIPSQ